MPGIGEPKSSSGLEDFLLAFAKGAALAGSVVAVIAIAVLTFSPSETDSPDTDFSSTDPPAIAESAQENDESAQSDSESPGKETEVPIIVAAYLNEGPIRNLIQGLKEEDREDFVANLTAVLEKAEKLHPVTIMEVTPGGPAEKAGLRVGDKPVPGYALFRRIVRENAEKQTEIEVDRDGTNLLLSITPEVFRMRDGRTRGRGGFVPSRADIKKISDAGVKYINTQGLRLKGSDIQMYRKVASKSFVLAATFWLGLFVALLALSLVVLIHHARR